MTDDKTLAVTALRNAYADTIANRLKHCIVDLETIERQPPNPAAAHKISQLKLMVSHAHNLSMTLKPLFADDRENV